MEEYLPISTTSEREFATKCCDAIEKAGIPVVMEHIDIIQDGRFFPAFRLFVPIQFRQSGIKLIETIRMTYEDGVTELESGILAADAA